MMTLHAYGTWMPDHPNGFVHRTRGLQPSDSGLADAYRFNQADPTVYLNGAVQCLIVDTAVDTAKFLDIEVLGSSTEPTHVHIIFRWTHDRTGKSIASSIRSRLSRELNQHFERKPNWWTAKGSLSIVKDDEHLEYLLETYLPDHRGWKWSAGRGCYR